MVVKGSPTGWERLDSLYDDALPVVYGYLVARLGSTPEAQDLTADVFVAAGVAAADGRVPEFSTRWLLGIARHKLLDHWRRLDREARRARQLEAAAGDGSEDPWEEAVDALVARLALDRLRPAHRAILTLRYLDGLTVGEVANELGRSVRSTETTLVRARRALRVAYEEVDRDDD